MKVFIGTLERDPHRIVTLDGATRLKHAAIFGKSGVGKTTLLRNMALADICSGLGITVIDPHGALVEDLLSAIPRSRTNDLIYFNPGERTHVVGLNVLESVKQSERHLVVSSVVSIMRHTWPDFWGPRSEWILEHCVHALLQQPTPMSLIALPRVLTDPVFRERIVGNLDDPAIQNFFRFFESQNERLRDESVAPLINKVSKFVTNPLLRAVLGQIGSSFDFRWLLDNRKVLLVNLSKGFLGEDVSSLLGSLIVTKLALASLSRQDIPENERVPHFLYADEIQNFAYGIDFPTILSESRKYALGLCIGTQALASIPDKTVASIFGNCGTIASFRVSGEDAHHLVREFGVSGEGPRTAEQAFDSIVPASELQNLPDYKLFIRTLHDGTPKDPELVNAFPPIPTTEVIRIWGEHSQPAVRDHVLRTSLKRFGRDRKMVEDRIRRFLATDDSKRSHQQRRKRMTN